MRLLLTLGAALGIALAPPGAAQTPAAHPDSARIVTSDIENFWRAYDRLAEATTREDSLQAFAEDYFAPASPGLQAFIRMRLEQPDALLFALDLLPRYYAAVRDNTLRIGDHEAAVREVLHRLHAVYPEATFPDIYLVVGGFSTKGTLSSEGLLIGAEMVSADATTPTDELPDFMRDVTLTADGLPCVVVHELVHHQQDVGGDRSLLRQALVEGVADFVTAQAVPECFPTPTYAWADAREAELWAEFREEMRGTDFNRWFYNGGQDADRPDNLGYWMGYQIAEAYYDRAQDKVQAVREMLHIDDVGAFLEASGYTKRADE